MRTDLILVSGAIAIAGVAVSCAVLGGAVAEKVATAVERYCEEPLSYRELYRNTVNSHLTVPGHVVHVHCSGDPTRTP
ncbi:hypothetical protein LCGC14_0639840 [marine sediment metagenome]|uniref:Uncharacterized protein n=1 Tax=marine sediment metagenome TaxID=412755 RepID=A0A0F9R4Q9_9ZZZZ